MLIGILADIHESVQELGVALHSFENRKVERIVTLGDAFETYKPGGPSTEVARVLDSVGAVGVWGNHDVGLSRNVAEVVQKEADPTLLRFASRLHPHLVIENCRFSHVEPWLDATDVMDLWRCDRFPESPERAQRSFDAVPEKYLFMGHYHLWAVMNTSARVDWDEETPLRLSPSERYLVVAAALRDGWCCTFDTEYGELTPIRCTGETRMKGTPQ